MARWIDAGPLAALAPGKVAYAEVDGMRIALCHAEGQVYAVDDVCTHDGGPLDQGELQGCLIECPRHGARFDVRTGKVAALPAILPIGTYPVKVEAGRILVDVDG